MNGNLILAVNIGVKTKCLPILIATALLGACTSQPKHTYSPDELRRARAAALGVSVSDLPAIDRIKAQRQYNRTLQQAEFPSQQDDELRARVEQLEETERARDAAEREAELYHGLETHNAMEVQDAYTPGP
jgi:hypothetical protein